MAQDELARRAQQVIAERVEADGPPEPRVVLCEAQTEWYPDLLRGLAEHEQHVLGRGPDIVVFFDDEGKVIGWRDDGRHGSEMPAWVDRDAFLQAIVRELGLPPETRLGELRPRELPPAGWTHEAVLFLATVPKPHEIVRVWAAPDTLRVIQCFYGPKAPEGGKP